jgi:hypothetical protein
LSSVTLGAGLILGLHPPPDIADRARRILRNGERMRTMLGELFDTLAIQPVARTRDATETTACSWGGLP